MIKRGKPTKTVLIVASAFLVQMLVCGIGISQNPSTPFDEAAHLDYVVKLSQGHVPKVNEKYGQTVLNWIACEPNIGEAWKRLEPCGSAHYEPKKAPFSGQSSATAYVPTYYLLTAIPFELCNRATDITLIKCARYSNSLWLAGSAALSALILSGFGVSALLALLVSVGVSSLPAVFLQGITVNSDAAAQLGAMLMVFYLMRYLSEKKFERIDQIKLCSLFVLSLTLKQTLLPLAGVLLAYFAVAKFKEGESKIRAYSSYLASISGVALSSMFLTKVQPIIRGTGGKDVMAKWLTASISDMPANLQLAVASALNPFTLLTWDRTALPLLSFLSLVIGYGMWILVGGHGYILTWQGKSIDLKSESVRGISILGLLLGPVLLAIIAFVVTRNYPIQPRYYMAGLSAMTVFSIGSSKNKPLVYSMAGLFTCSLFLVLKALI